MSVLGVLPNLVLASDVTDPHYDAVLVVQNADVSLVGPVQALNGIVENYLQLDLAAKSSQVAVILVPAADLPSGRLIFSPTGPLNRDYDDVRRYQDAASNGIKRALSAGCKKPLLVCPKDDRYPQATRVALLAALQTAYTPIEIREARPEIARKLETLGFILEGGTSEEIQILKAIESGRIVYRDIGGSDPERMAAPRVAEYIENLFNGTCVEVSVISDIDKLQAEYPLLAAVNRAAINVPRHAARLINLEYVGEGPIDTTLMLVGKGITYDTGGADLKVNGHMAGMHRDKCGAACVAGFFQLLSVYKPKGLKVIGAMAMVRNSIGSEAYVADELITSRAGVRVRIGNTDAEGRMVMADVLCHMKERSAEEKNPLLFTIATLTGHVIRAFGPNYTAVMENGPAKNYGVARLLQESGESSGDPFEISHIRREDYAAHAGQSEYEDVLQAMGESSTQTNRGHQGPAAFLILTSGLDKHGNDSSHPIKYSHVDIAGSSGPFPGVPTGAPLVAMAHAFVLNRESAN